MRLTTEQIAGLIPRGYRNQACRLLEAVFLGEYRQGLSLFEQAAGLVAGIVISHPVELTRMRYLKKIQQGGSVADFLSFVSEVENQEPVVPAPRVRGFTLLEDLYAWMGQIVLDILVGPNPGSYTLMDEVELQYTSRAVTADNRQRVYLAVVELLGEEYFMQYIKGLYLGFERYSITDFYTLGEEAARFAFSELKEDGVFESELPKQQGPDMSVVYKVMDELRGRFQLRMGVSIESQHNVSLSDFLRDWVPIFDRMPAFATDREIRQLSMFLSRHLSPAALAFLSGYTRSGR